MDFLELDRRIMKLLAARQFDVVEQELNRAKLRASEEGDNSTLEQVLSSLVELYCSMHPPDLAKAESYSLERERISGTGYAKLQTAQVLYWAVHDADRTVLKVQEAIEAANREHDDKTVYQSLGLLGLALLDLHKADEVRQVLNEIERMVSAKRRIVVGDEAVFLERLFAQTTEMGIRESIRRIAAVLSPLCHETQFKNRLAMLANG